MHMDNPDSLDDKTRDTFRNCQQQIERMYRASTQLSEAFGQGATGIRAENMDAKNIKFESEEKMGKPSQTNEKEKNL